MDPVVASVTLLDFHVDSRVILDLANATGEVTVMDKCLSMKHIWGCQSRISHVAHPRFKSNKLIFHN